MRKKNSTKRISKAIGFTKLFNIFIRLYKRKEIHRIKHLISKPETLYEDALKEYAKFIKRVHRKTDVAIEIRDLVVQKLKLHRMASKIVKGHRLEEERKARDLKKIQDYMSFRGWFKKPTSLFLENVYKFHNKMFWDRMMRDEWIPKDKHII